MPPGIYADLPKKIFGLKPSQHRAFKMRDILVHCNKRVGMRTKKIRMLELLVPLEQEVTGVEKERIESWLSGRWGYRGTIQEALERETSEVHNDDDSDLSKINIDDDSDLETVINAGGLLGPPTIECTVCMEEFDADRFPQENITSACEHEPTICNSCLTQSVDSQIQDKPWDQISCPECLKLLSFDGVKKMASAASFERYDRLAVMSVFRDMPNFAMCLDPGCSSGQIHDGGNDHPIMTCDTCHFKTCFTHMMPWHTGLTCSEYDAQQKERFEQEAASEKFVSETSVICPNPNCGFRIYKYTGCDHMRCRQCQHQFCYVCLAPWDRIMAEGNTAHAQNCMYNTRILDIGTAAATEAVRRIAQQLRA